VNASFFVLILFIGTLMTGIGVSLIALSTIELLEIMDRPQEELAAQTTGGAER